MRLLEPLGISDKKISFADIVSTSAIEKTPLRDEFVALREKFEIVTIVAPRGGVKYRRWPSDRYGEVIRYLTRKPDMAVAIVNDWNEYITKEWVDNQQIITNAIELYNKALENNGVDPTIINKAVRETYVNVS